MKPILFNTEMVRAILEGRKTATRRVVKPQPGSNGMVKMSDQSCYPGYWAEVDSERVIKPPYQSGDVLYVRETWSFIPCIDCRLYENGRCNDLPVTYDDGDSIGEGCFVYRADYPETDRISWRPSIHMPREAARIFLRVTEVRVERLQKANYFDALREGIPYRQYEVDILKDFSCLWDKCIKISDIGSYGWEANPWVWVIELERMEAGKDGEADSSSAG